MNDQPTNNLPWAKQLNISSQIVLVILTGIGFLYNCGVLVGLSLADQQDTSKTQEELLSLGASDWKYWDAQEAPDKSWTAVDFDDSKWKSGSAPLGYGERDIETRLSYGKESRRKYPVAYFRRTVELAEVSDLDVMLVSIRADDGAIIYINGEEADRHKILPPEEANGEYIGYQGSVEGVAVPLLLPGRLFKKGTNQIAISVHQRDPTSSDLVLDVGLRGMTAGQAQEYRQADLFPVPNSEGELYVNDAAFYRYAQFLGRQWRAAGKLPTLRKMLSRVREDQPCKLELAPLNTEKKSAAQLYEENRKSILAIFHVGPDDRRSAMGSGAIVSKSGAAITNLHVITSADRGSGEIRMSGDEGYVAVNMDGDYFPVTSILAASARQDVAIVQLGGASFHPLPIVTGTPVGQPVTVISSPHRQMFHLSTGFVTRYAVHALNNQRRVMSISAPLGGGSSGGAVLDECGNITGIAMSVLPLAGEGVSVVADDSDGMLKIRKDADTGLHLNRDHELTISLCVPARTILALTKSP